MGVREMIDGKKRGLAFIAEIDAMELAVRLMSIGIGLRRPNENKDTPKEIISRAKERWPQEAGPFPFDRMAVAALEYFRECIEKGQKPS